MTPDQLKESYRRDLEQVVTVRRYTGSGLNRPKFDAQVKGKSVAYGEKELTGSILQTDLHVFVLIEDLIAKGLAMPIVASDKIVVVDRSQELAIQSIITRKAPDGTPIAYELQARG